ncbi:MAG TPA: prepilin peptidase, partial [Roseomonas sp.]
MGLLALAAWRDLATRLIPDTLPGTIALLGLLLRASEGMAELGISVAIALLLFLFLALLHSRGMLGGGDVKLLSAVALGLAPLAIWDFIFATALAGGVL